MPEQKPKISKAALAELIQQEIAKYDLSEAFELKEGKDKGDGKLPKMFASSFGVSPKATLTFEGETLHSRQFQMNLIFQDVRTPEFAVKQTAAPAKAATISLADLRARLSSKAQSA